MKRIRAREPAHLRPVLRAAARPPGVDVDKCSLKVAIEPIGSVSRRAVSRAFRRMKAHGAVDAAPKTATTDNGCEVSHQRTLERILGWPRLLHAGVRLLREGGRRERQPRHQAAVPEGDGLLEGPARGRPRGRDHRQLDTQTLAERRDRT